VRRGWWKSASAVAFAPALLLTGCASSSSDVSYVGNSNRPSMVSRADDATRAALRLQLAIGYYRQGQFLTVLEEAGLALRAMPDFADAYNVRALAYMALGQSAQAENDFLRALRLAPENPDFANNYARFLCSDVAGLRVSEAMHYFERALSKSAYGLSDVALLNAGKCSLSAGNVAAAEQYFLRGFAHAPANPAINVNLGKLYFDRDEFERARVHIDLARKNHVLKVDALWLAIKIERKLGNQAAENDLVVQLRHRYPSSSEYAAYRRGAFDE
jgi:type IV pilus assembly protein PilF